MQSRQAPGGSSSFSLGWGNDEGMWKDSSDMVALEITPELRF